MTYAFGDRYEGQLRDGVPGRGKYICRWRILAMNIWHRSSSHGKKFPMCNGAYEGVSYGLRSKYGGLEDDNATRIGIFTANVNNGRDEERATAWQWAATLAPSMDLLSALSASSMPIEGGQARCCEYTENGRDIAMGKGRGTDGTTYTGTWAHDDRCG